MPSHLIPRSSEQAPNAFDSNNLAGPQTADLHGNPACQLRARIPAVKCSSIAEQLLLELAALLRLERQRRRRAREQPGNADRLARLLAVAVIAAVDTGQRDWIFLSSLRSRSRVRSSSACSSSIVARSAGSGTITVSRRCSVVSSALASSSRSICCSRCLKNASCRLVHIVGFRHLEQLLLRRQSLAIHNQRCLAACAERVNKYSVARRQVLGRWAGVIFGGASLGAVLASPGAGIGGIGF